MVRIRLDTIRGIVGYNPHTTGCTKLKKEINEVKKKNEMSIL